METVYYSRNKGRRVLRFSSKQLCRNDRQRQRYTPQKKKGKTTFKRLIFERAGNPR